MTDPDTATAPDPDAETQPDLQPAETHPADPPVCGEPTRSGGRCKVRPFGGRKGTKCYRHAGLGTTDAQRWNAVKHGYFLTGFLGDEERVLFEQVSSGELDPARLKGQMAGALAVRASRIANWERRKRQVSPHTNGAFAELRHLLAILPQPEAKGPAIDPAELAREVQKLLKEDPELFLAGLPPAVQEATRKVLREGGVLPQGGAPGGS